MVREHWFDTVNKALSQATTRREIARSVTLLLPSLLLSGATDATAAKKKPGGGNGKRNKNKKAKPKPKPKPSCSGGACAAVPEWAGDQDEIDYCEFICRQCDGNDPRNFCIVEGDPFDPAKVAVCCVEGGVCCGAKCCGGPSSPNRQCCDGTCTNTEGDPENCGSCGHRCETGQVCIRGSCGCLGAGCSPGCPPPYISCGEWCMNPGHTCCEGGPAGHYICPPNAPCCVYHIPPHRNFCYDDYNAPCP